MTAPPLSNSEKGDPDKSNPSLYSEHRKSRLRKRRPRVIASQRAAPTLKEWIENLVGRITHSLIGSQ